MVQIDCPRCGRGVLDTDDAVSTMFGPYGKRKNGEPITTLNAGSVIPSRDMVGRTWGQNIALCIYANRIKDTFGTKYRTCATKSKKAVVAFADYTDWRRIDNHV